MFNLAAFTVVVVDFARLTRRGQPASRLQSKEWTHRTAPSSQRPGRLTGAQVLPVVMSTHTHTEGESKHTPGAPPVVDFAPATKESRHFVFLFHIHRCSLSPGRPVVLNWQPVDGQLASIGWAKLIVFFVIDAGLSVALGADATVCCRRFLVTFLSSLEPLIESALQSTAKDDQVVQKSISEAN